MSLSPLGLLLPPLLAVLRVRLVLPLQTAALAGLRRPLSCSATPAIAILVVFPAITGGRRATVVIVVFTPQEGALPAGGVDENFLYLVQVQDRLCLVCLNCLEPTFIFYTNLLLFQF